MLLLSYCITVTSIEQLGWVAVRLGCSYWNAIGMFTEWWSPLIGASKPTSHWICWWMTSVIYLQWYLWSQKVDVSEILHVVIGRVITVTAATVSNELHLKRKLPDTSADCCDRRFIKLCVSFAIIKVISNNISFTNK